MDSGPGTLKNSIDVGASLFVARQTTPGAGVQLRPNGPNQTPLVVKNNGAVRFLKAANVLTRCDESIIEEGTR